MATLNTPGPDDDGGQVVSLDAARATRTGPGRHPGPGPAPRPGHPPDNDGPVLEGEVVRVDQPGPDRADWLADLAARTKDRRPIVHPALRSRREAAATVRWVAGALPAREPVPPGPGAEVRREAGRACPPRLHPPVSGLTRWAYDLEGHPVRMATVLKADPEAYLKLSRQRDSRVRLRVPITVLAVIAALVAAVLALAAPAPVKLAILAVPWPSSASSGAPADRPLIDRAVTGSRVEKLTSDVVIRALALARAWPRSTRPSARTPRPRSSSRPPSPGTAPAGAPTSTCPTG